MRHLFLILSLVFTFAALPAQASEKAGRFKGANNHITSGTVTVTDAGDTLIIKLSSNFSFDGAPDPYVSLANGKRKPLVNVAVLKKDNGVQTYRIKKTAELSKASHVLIWCKKFAVTLGHAKLN
ncbi:MAG: DM13 domain-containing protein [Roseibium sp.]